MGGKGRWRRPVEKVPLVAGDATFLIACPVDETRDARLQVYNNLKTRRMPPLSALCFCFRFLVPLPLFPGSPTPPSL